MDKKLSEEVEVAECPHCGGILTANGVPMIPVSESKKPSERIKAIPETTKEVYDISTQDCIISILDELHEENKQLRTARVFSFVRLKPRSCHVYVR